MTMLTLLIHRDLFFLAAYEANTVVDDRHIAFWVMTICGSLEGLLKELKFLGYIDSQGLPTYLDRDFVEHLLVVEEKRTEINPYSFRLKRCPYCVDIVKDVVSSI